MLCPRCKHPNFINNCTKCGFQGDPDQINELLRLEWLQTEMDTWISLGILKQIPKKLQKHYETRREEVRFQLGLTYFPFTPQEAANAAPELRRYERLFAEMEKWQTLGYLKTGFLPQYYARLLELRSRLADYPIADSPTTDREQLDEINFILDAIQYLNYSQEFTSP